MTGGTRGELLDAVRAVASGARVTGAVVGEAGEAAAERVAFVFPGQGSQWVGMAEELLDTSPVFGERFAACGAALEPYVGWSLTDVVRGA
ncbi:acyltransferase domain-containing protein, partial [Streptomyces cacaoi]|uniref:acyltransferase domain-containing protein n=1 Tax=Streptomyces cacaoi TaxID=1898 RepID=UPI00262F1B04